VFLLGSAAAGFQALLRPAHSGHLLAAVMAQYLPFAVVNGILTSMPVFRYDESAILGTRLGSIPVEDAIYAMVMLVATVSCFEALAARRVGRDGP
jgi:lycopene cyclase domain-containing protein